MYAGSMSVSNWPLDIILRNLINSSIWPCLSVCASPAVSPLCLSSGLIAVGGNGTTVFALASRPVAFVESLPTRFVCVLLRLGLGVDPGVDNANLLILGGAWAVAASSALFPVLGSELV